MLPLLNRARRETRAGERADAGAAMRRLRRLFRHYRQSGARRGGRHPGAQRRHGDPLGDAGDLWRRASADAPRRDAPRSATSSSSASAGGRTIAPAQRRRDEQQPLARQQGGRADDDPGEIAGRGGQGRHDPSERGLSIRRAGHRQGLRLHGYARLRSGVGDRPGGGRSECARLHHRARLRLWLQADAVDQARHQQRCLPPHDRRHGHQLRRRARRRFDRRQGQGDFRQGPRGRLRRAHQVRSSSAMATRNSRPGRSGRRCDGAAPRFSSISTAPWSTATRKASRGVPARFAPTGSTWRADAMQRRDHGRLERHDRQRRSCPTCRRTQQAATLDAKEEAYRDGLASVEAIAGAVALSWTLPTVEG